MTKNTEIELEKVQKALKEVQQNLKFVTAEKTALQQSLGEIVNANINLKTQAILITDDLRNAQESVNSLNAQLTKTTEELKKEKEELEAARQLNKDLSFECEMIDADSDTL